MLLIAVMTLDINDLWEKGSEVTVHHCGKGMAMGIVPPVVPTGKQNATA